MGKLINHRMGRSPHAGGGMKDVTNFYCEYDPYRNKPAFTDPDSNEHVGCHGTAEFEILGDGPNGGIRICRLCAQRLKFRNLAKREIHGK